jgi:hypothetical protein
MKRFGALGIRSEASISFRLVHRNANLDGTIDFAVVHQVSPDDTFIVFNFIHIFSKVELDFPKHILLY